MSLFIMSVDTKSTVKLSSLNCGDLFKCDDGDDTNDIILMVTDHQEDEEYRGVVYLYNGEVSSMLGDRAVIKLTGTLRYRHA